MKQFLNDFPMACAGETAGIKFKRYLFAFMLLSLLISVGCARTDPGLGRLDGPWGPGVCDVEAARAKMLAMARDVNGGNVEYYRYEISAVAQTMTWQQITHIYRTPHLGDVRPLLLDAVIGYEKYSGVPSTRFPTGISRDAIINILGPPDGDWETSLVYTGTGRVSDDSYGFLFELDKDFRLKHIGCGP